MKRKLFVAISAGFLILMLTCVNSHAQCQGESGKGLAVAYANVFAFPDNLPRFVNGNVGYFKSNGPSINCGREFARQLMQKAISCPAYNQIYQQAVNVAGQAGVPHMAPNLANSMYQYTTDMSLLTRYINELIYVLPFMTDGNLTPYHNSSIYQISSFLWNQTKNVLMPQQFHGLRDATYEMNMWYIRNLMNAMH